MNSNPCENLAKCQWRAFGTLWFPTNPTTVRQKLPGLESEMRKGIFLADPRDVDAMLAAAHEIHGGRQIAPPGW